MCGILGIVSERDVAPELYYGMCSLQHRGQDAAGMLVFNGNGPWLKKGIGQVTEVFQPEDVLEMKGNVGIGHTRYPTASSNDKAEDAHPCIVASTKRIGMCHNGNLTNYYRIREMLKKRGVFLETENDVEPMAKIFAHEFEKTEDPFYAVKKVMEVVEGGYSVLVAIEGVGILAFRDPHGIRPLTFGKNNAGYCFSSESIVFQQLGYDRVRDVRAGEAILVKTDGSVEERTIMRGTPKPCMFEWIYFARPDSLIDDRSVWNARINLGLEMAKEWDKEIDVVIPVPDTARTAAMKFAETIGVKYREGLIKNRYSVRTFIMPDQESRERAVNIKLNPIISVVRDQRVAVVDDSIVRGTTSKRIVSLLRRAGAKEVHFISTCPPIVSPCFYGIDMPTKKELIASKKTIEEIREYIGADSLTYQSIENVKAATKKDDLCMACLTGEYPVEIKDKEQMSEARIKARNC